MKITIIVLPLIYPLLQDDLLYLLQIIQKTKQLDPPKTLKLLRVEQRCHEEYYYPFKISSTILTLCGCLVTCLLLSVFFIKAAVQP